jgi:hypothetical protein
MGGPPVDCFRNPVGAVRVLFDKACRAATSPADFTRSDWGVKELFESYLFGRNVHCKVATQLSPFYCPLLFYSGILLIIVILLPSPWLPQADSEESIGESRNRSGVFSALDMSFDSELLVVTETAGT